MTAAHERMPLSGSAGPSGGQRGVEPVEHDQMNSAAGAGVGALPGALGAGQGDQGGCGANPAVRQMLSTTGYLLSGQSECAAASWSQRPEFLRWGTRHCSFGKNGPFLAKPGIPGPGLGTAGSEMAMVSPPPEFPAIDQPAAEACPGARSPARASPMTSWPTSISGSLLRTAHHELPRRSARNP
jgi:hypothetical protein